MGFCQWPEMGPKVGFGVQGAPKTHFLLKGGGNSFLKRALRQSQPSINQTAKIQNSPFSFFWGGGRGDGSVFWGVNFGFRRVLQSVRGPHDPTPRHKIITHEKMISNKYFRKITNFTRNFLNQSFIPGDFEGAKSIKTNET